MYVAPHNREKRIAVIHDAIDLIRFGTLVTVGPDGPIATHVPMFLELLPEPRGTIYGHIARANDQWQKTNPKIPALATFVGPQAYISPSFYATKRETGKVVPTWQYLAVQARGPIAFIHDRDRLLEIVRASTLTQEARNEHPWAVEDAPQEYVDSMLGAIVGFTIEIAAIDGAWKFSHNKNDADLHGVIDGLEDRGDTAVASLVRERGGAHGPTGPMQP
ncbi:MAG TPA: FMN-binding negative transcriptional regulator [Candidatus Eremiobacteraceae bacterium]